MQNNQTYIVDEEKILPFSLHLLIGNGEKGDCMVLSHLCKSPYALSTCIYEIQELKPLRLQFQGKAGIRVAFIWNKVYEGRKQQEDRGYDLHAKHALVLLYEHGKTDFVYPWRCGLYHFEVKYEEETYYGAFRITPKNFYDEQLTLIQQTVQSVYSSLITDRGHYKKTFTLLADLEDESQMKSIRWLSQHIITIKRLYTWFEHDVTYETVEKKERKYRKPTKRTVRKSEKKYMQEKQWNRRHSYVTDHPTMQFMKKKTIDFLNTVEGLRLFLQQNMNKLQYLATSGKKEKEAVQTILQTIERNGSVTERDKQKYKNIQMLKDTDMRKVSVKIQEYRVLYAMIDEISIYIRALLHSSFWQPIKPAPIPAVVKPMHRKFLMLMDQLQEKVTNRMQQPTLLFVYKPTFLIYEYYVFFALVHILEEMNFSPVRPIKEQIQSFFYLDGLQDGTTIILEREDIQLHLVFNELIETHPLIALSKGSHFYNGEDTKKPDIRIDYFRKRENEWYYDSSTIVEVKYSPMYNIFQPVGNTKATEQMYKYWSIKYVTEQQGKQTFQRKAIHEVICVYPGSQVHAKKIETGCGVFLQFYPYKRKKRELLMGKKEFISLFQDWFTK